MKNILSLFVLGILIGGCGSDKNTEIAKTQTAPTSESAPAVNNPTNNLVPPLPKAGVAPAPYSITLFWDAPTNMTAVDSYNVWQQIDGGPFVQILNTTAKQALIPVKPSLVYVFYVSSFSAAAQLDGPPSKFAPYVLSPKLTMSKTGLITTSVASGQSYILQSSTNLKTWATAQTTTAASDNISFQVPTTGTPKFFRLLRVVPTGVHAPLSPPELMVASMAASNIVAASAAAPSVPSAPSVTTAPSPQAEVIQPPLPPVPQVNAVPPKGVLRYRSGAHFDPVTRFQK
ncbi:MAG: hypothetical protein JWQ35_966 [Bacteriovoracaceae bacterium]|nr:hypothetical protein [Bacteriovoracaceae bacterium]